jgi:septal ring factor EnvC (AmiA/AmiB activator)
MAATPERRIAASLAVLASALFLTGVPWASAAPPGAGAVPRYAEQLDSIRTRATELEDALIQNQSSQKQAHANLKRLQSLIKLRQEEHDLGRRRLAELEATVVELETRRENLNEKLRLQRDSVRRLLAAIEASLRGAPDGSAVSNGEALAPSVDRIETFVRAEETEKLEAPRRKLMANLVSHGLKELEMLHVDLEDSDQLGSKIQEEKQQLAYLFQDLDEKESVLELNRQLQAELLHKSHEDRLAQLENYRKLKSSQAQVEQLIQDFNARRELEHSTDTERMVSKMMERGAFAQLKGRLQLPVESGKVISSFGRAFDPKSKLYIFKKGVDILAGKSQAVRAIFAGKVAYSGDLPEYGQVTIIDHGGHFYSLCAHLGRLDRKAGDPVAAGDSIGLTDDSGTPVYFEIRARNVAVNPLQWVSN